MNTTAVTLPARVREHAVQRANCRALAFLDPEGRIQEDWTFGQLDRRARSIAAHLQDADLAGHGVVLVYPPGLEFAAAFLGCLYAGAIAIPACPPRAHRVDDRLQAILHDSGAVCVLTSTPLSESIDRQLIGLDAMKAFSTDALPDDSDAWSPVAWLPGQIAFLQYTSGSTRSPRGVMISHGNLVANLKVLRELLDFREETVSVTWLPLFHDMGLIGGVLEALWVGYSNILMAPASFMQSPLRWLKAISRYRGTAGGGPNFAYQACVDAAMSSDIRDLDLSSWRMAWNGAEPVRAVTLERFRATFAPVGFRAESLTPTFGLAEATLVVTGDNGTSLPYEIVVDESKLRGNRVQECEPTHSSSRRLVSSGMPGSGVRVCIVDPDTRRLSAPDRVGEIWVSGDSVALGYWKKPEETLETFGASMVDSGDGPFLRTGDLGFLHRGALFVTGRQKDIICVRGISYYPHDIEHTVASSHPALRPDAAAVVGIEDDTGVRLVSLQEVRRDCLRGLEPEAVFDAVRRAVSKEHHLALDAIVLLKPFGVPKTSSGKVQRARCRHLLEEGRLPIVFEWWAPWNKIAPLVFNGEPLSQSGVLERKFVDWLQQELAVKDLTWRTPLLELGVDSLKAVELSNQLGAAFNYPFSASLIIDYPTVEDLATFVREQVLEIRLPKDRPRSQKGNEGMAAKMNLVPGKDELSAFIRGRVFEAASHGDRSGGEGKLAERINLLEESELDAALREGIGAVIKGVVIE